MSQREPCYYCGKSAGTRDHVTPRSKGGTRTVPACGVCNSSKGSLTVEEFRAVLAVRNGLLPELNKLMKFWCETQPLICKHGRFTTEMCVKCGRWHWNNVRLERKVELKYQLSTTAPECLT